MLSEFDERLVTFATILFLAAGIVVAVWTIPRPGEPED